MTDRLTDAHTDSDTHTEADTAAEVSRHALLVQVHIHTHTLCTRGCGAAGRGYPGRALGQGGPQAGLWGVRMPQAGLWGRVIPQTGLWGRGGGTPDRAVGHRGRGRVIPHVCGTMGILNTRAPGRRDNPRRSGG